MSAVERIQFLNSSVAERDMQIDELAKAVGRFHLWSVELSEILQDNRDTEKELIEGNHPIRDEYLMLAKFGVNALRMGGYAI